MVLLWYMAQIVHVQWSILTKNHRRGWHEKLPRVEISFNQLSLNAVSASDPNFLTQSNESSTIIVSHDGFSPKWCHHRLPWCFRVYTQVQAIICNALKVALSCHSWGMMFPSKTPAAHHSSASLTNHRCVGGACLVSQQQLWVKQSQKPEKVICACDCITIYIIYHVLIHTVFASELSLSAMKDNEGSYWSKTDDPKDIQSA